MKKILGALRRADERFSLIENGDTIAVGLSGGKDSMVMLRALALYKLFSKKDYGLVAVMVDLGFGGADPAAVAAFAEENGVPLHILKTQIGEIVFDVRKEKNPCALCAKMRKGAFYARAKELGCNKAAFAHHMEDAIETFLLSMLYESRLHTFAPKTYLSRQDITLIRPLIFAAEKDIVAVREKYGIPVLKNPCPADGHTKREEAKEILSYLCEKRMNAKQSIFKAVSDSLMKE
jgi:tRNA(Ile)-lysidine synthase TilS/MesJ